MATLTRLIRFVFLCFVLKINSSEGRIAYKKHWELSGRIEYGNYDTSDNYYNLTYINYDIIKPNGFESNFIVVQDTQPEKSCPFSAHAHGDWSLQIYPLGLTRSVILWVKTANNPTEKILSMCSILDFNTCRSKELVLSDYVANSPEIFMAYDDSFDIVILCSEKMYCKYNIDLEGRIISKLKSWLQYDPYRDYEGTTLRVLVTDERRKLYVTNTLDGYLKSSLEKSDGSWVILLPILDNSVTTEFEVLNEEDDKYVKNIVAYSTSHGSIGISAAIETCAKVWQFDEEGNLKLNASIVHDFFVNYVRIYNLADGGFFLLTMGTGRERTTIFDNKFEKYYLTKVAADGNIIGTIQNAADPDVNFSRDTKVQLFENEANEYCVNFENTVHYRRWDGERSEADRLVMCFKGSDFS